MRTAGFAHPPCRLGDGDQLGRRPHARRVGANHGVVDVLVEPTRVLKELARGDPVGIGEVRKETVDPRVEVDAALLGELQHDDGDEGLGDAADVQRHVRIQRSAGRIERLRTRRDLGDRAVAVAHGEARTDEIARGAMQLEDVRERLAKSRVGGGRGRLAARVNGRRAGDGGEQQTRCHRRRRAHPCRVHDELLVWCDATVCCVVGPSPSDGDEFFVTRGRRWSMVVRPG